LNVSNTSEAACLAEEAAEPKLLATAGIVLIITLSIEFYNTVSLGF
jgi:hypothetical protein